MQKCRDTCYMVPEWMQAPESLAIAKDLLSGAADPGGGQRVHNNRGWIQRFVLRRIRLEKRQELTHRLAHAAAGRRAAGTTVGTGIATCISGGSV